MKTSLQALFRTLPPAHRAKYHGLYCSIMRAIDDGDTEVIPHLLTAVPPASDPAAQSAFLAQVQAIIDAG